LQGNHGAVRQPTRGSFREAESALRLLRQSLRKEAQDVSTLFRFEVPEQANAAIDR
jgi:hypothetical protein